jgi:hypothetical protein
MAAIDVSSAVSLISENLESVALVGSSVLLVWVAIWSLPVFCEALGYDARDEDRWSGVREALGYENSDDRIIREESLLAQEIEDEKGV